MIPTRERFCGYCVHFQGQTKAARFGICSRTGETVQRRMACGAFERDADDADPA